MKPKYVYGTSFMKNGSSVCYRYINSRNYNRDSRVLVYSKSKKLYITNRR